MQLLPPDFSCVNVPNLFSSEFAAGFIYFFFLQQSGTRLFVAFYPLKEVVVTERQKHRLYIKNEQELFV